MKKIIIIGSPGAGKSTFARKLRDVTGLPLYYLDMLWHTPERTHISREEFDTRLDRIINSDRWIIDGNYQRTLEVRLRTCDTVFLMDFPPDLCLAGAQSRIGSEREDLPWIESEFDRDFRQWIIDFPREQLPRIYELLRKYQIREPQMNNDNKKIIIFKSREEADAWISELTSALSLESSP